MAPRSLTTVLLGGREGIIGKSGLLDDDNASQEGNAGKVMVSERLHNRNLAREAKLAFIFGK